MNPANVSIRKVQQTDYELMTVWLSTEKVLEFYGNVNSPFTLAQIKNKYEPRVNGDVPVIPYIVELDRTPIGFMQQYKLTDKKKEEFKYYKNLNIYGIDQFIGVPNLFNKGIGTIMVSKFIDYIFQNTDTDLIILDTDISNVRAIKCYEKCGFIKVKKLIMGTVG